MREWEYQIGNLSQEEYSMVFDDDREGLLTELQYKGRVMKIVGTAADIDAIRIIDTSTITEVDYTMTVGTTTLRRLDKAGTTSAFLFAMQLLGILMVDAADLENNDESSSM